MNVKLPYVPDIPIEYVPESDPFMSAAKEFARLNATDRQMPTGSVRAFSVSGVISLVMVAASGGAEREFVRRNITRN